MKHASVTNFTENFHKRNGITKNHKRSLLVLSAYVLMMLLACSRIACHRVFSVNHWVVLVKQLSEYGLSYNTQPL